jgi:hypothetical protein
MRRFGASEEQIAAALAKRGAARGDADDGAFLVEPDAWDSWLFFMSVQRQWVRVGLDARRDRMDWPAIHAVAQMQGLFQRRMAQLVADLLVIEREVLAEDGRIDAGRPRRRGR